MIFVWQKCWCVLSPLGSYANMRWQFVLRAAFLHFPASSYWLIFHVLRTYGHHLAGPGHVKVHMLGPKQGPLGHVNPWGGPHYKQNLSVCVCVASKIDFVNMFICLVFQLKLHILRKRYTVVVVADQSSQQGVWYSYFLIPLLFVLSINLTENIYRA